MNIELNLAWTLVGKHREPLNPELVALLDGVASGGNLRYAARAAKLSYRHAWGVIKYWEQYFGHTLVELVRGRGAVLTTAGQTLRDTWHKTNERAHAALQDAASFAQRGLEALTRQQEEGVITIVASHGLGGRGRPAAARQRAEPRALRGRRVPGRRLPPAGGRPRRAPVASLPAPTRREA